VQTAVRPAAPLAAPAAADPSVGAEVIYEVECSLDPAIAADFDAWLPGHVRDVLAAPGFLDAETLRPTEPSPDGRVRRVNRYRVRDRGALDHYLEQLAPAIRQDGITRFGDRATYVRRVYAHTPYAPAADVCANCRTPLRGDYCHECGQHAHESARSLGTLFHDAWHVLTHVDGRFWQTLRRLAFSPGHLTTEYFQERRARYIPPFRLYIVLSLVFFGLASLSNVFDREAIVMDGDTKAKTAEELRRDAAELAAQRAELAKQGGVAPVVADVALAKAEAEIQKRIEATSAGAADATPKKDGPSVHVGTKGMTAPVGAPAAARAGVRDRNGLFYDPQKCAELNIEPAWLARLFGPGVKAACMRSASDGGKSLMHAIGANVPKMMFVFLPLIAAVMLLLYWFPRRYYVEHLVFYLHVHAGMFLLLSVVMLLGLLANVLPPLESVVALAGFLSFFYATWYVWRAMRAYYGNGRFLTFVKLWVIFFAYVTCLSLTFVGTALVTALEG
jgi:hypothetical protein